MIPLSLLLFQWMFGAVRVDADSAAAPIVHAIPTPTGTYAEPVLAGYLDGLSGALNDAGHWYPVIEIAAAWLSPDSTRIHLDIRVEAGPPVLYEGLDLSGGTRFPVERVRFRIPDRSGARADRSLREAVRRDLMRTGLYRSVDVRAPTYRDGRDLLAVAVEDVPPGQADGLLGWNNGDWMGSLDIRLRHALALGHELSIRIDRLRRLETDLNVRSSWHRIANTPLSADLEGVLIQQDSTFLVLALSAGVDHTPFNATRTGFWVERRQVETGGTARPDVEEGGFRMAGVRYGHASLSDPFFPTSGSRHRIQAGSGVRDDGGRVGRLIADWETVIASLGRGVVVATGSIGIFQADSVRYDERFRVGGAASFRGLPEGSIRASRFAWTEIEGRYALDRETVAFAFTGLAGASGRPTVLNAGLGVRYVTRAGIFHITAAGTSDDWRRPVLHVRLTTGR